MTEQAREQYRAEARKAVTQTQQQELLERRCQELLAMKVELEKEQRTNARLALDRKNLTERLLDADARVDELEGQLAAAIAGAPAPEHVQRTLGQFQQREADLVAEVEALKGERDGLRLEIAACRETAEELKAAAGMDETQPYSIGFSPEAGRLQFTWRIGERSRKAIADFERHIVERALRSGVTVDELARVVAEYPQEMRGWPEQISDKDLVRYRELARQVARMLGVAIQDPPDIRTVQNGSGQPVEFIVGTGGAEAAERFTREADPWGSNG